MLIESNIKTIAEEKNFTPTELSYSARIAWNTAKKMMNQGKIDNAPLVTLIKVAGALGCDVADLYTVKADGDD